MMVTVGNRKGKDLVCILDMPRRVKSLPAILVVHGFKGTSDERHIRAISDSLTYAGFITLRPDLTKNPGNSYLDFADVTYKQELLDLEDVFDYLLKIPQVDISKIGIVGHSLGGMLSAELVAKRKEVKSLVTLSAVYDFRTMTDKVFKKSYKDFKRDFDQKGWTAVWSTTLAKHLKIKKAFYKDILFRTADKFVKEISCPTLVISSDSDESVSQEHADCYFKNISSKVKRMEIIKSSDHIYSGGALDNVTKLTAD